MNIISIKQIKDEYETKSETKDLIEDIKKALSIAD